MQNSKLEKTAVIGAAGKMGSGISLLLLQAMAMHEAEKNGFSNSKSTLTLIDVNENGLPALRKYLRSQMTRYAEKNINTIRKFFSNNNKIVSNEDVIKAFLEGAFDMIRFDSDLIAARNSKVIFEAMVENISAKTELFKTLKETRKSDQYYLTNTSSIPIALLNSACELNNQIIGFHFYNPPAIQKLVEIIFPADTDSELVTLAHELAKLFRKITVQANDIAGFIGNGYFIREVIYACQQVKLLAIMQSITLSQAIYVINSVTQDFLIRPMGIFQLIDYVGVDVCANIAKVMRQYLPDDSLRDELLDQMVSEGILGGQFADGSQKNGFFQYESGEIVGVYSLDKKKYLPISEAKDAVNIGIIPEGHVGWKKLLSDQHKGEKLSVYFQNLSREQSLGAQIARNFLDNLTHIASQLVFSGAARDKNDVDTVLKNGFYHLYGVQQK